PGGRFGGRIRGLLGVALAWAPRIRLQISSRDSSRSSSCRIRFILLESFYKRIRNSAWRSAPQHELHHLPVGERAVLAVDLGDRVKLPAPDRRGSGVVVPGNTRRISWAAVGSWWPWQEQEL